MLLPVLGFSLNLGCFDLPYFTEYLQLYSDLFGLYYKYAHWVQAMFPGVGGTSCVWIANCASVP